MRDNVKDILWCQLVSGCSLACQWAQIELRRHIISFAGWDRWNAVVVLVTDQPRLQLSHCSCVQLTVALGLDEVSLLRWTTVLQTWDGTAVAYRQASLKQAS